MPPLRPRPPAEAAAPTESQAWLEAFRRGDADVIADCYRSHRQEVRSSAVALVGMADAETVVQEVFFRLMTQPEMRRSYRGPALGAWLAAIARNGALDMARRRRRERPVAAAPPAAWASHRDADEDTAKRILLERFRCQHVPPEWAAVFETRFVHEMTQREAARHLGVGRTTLAYRERQLLRRLRDLVHNT